MKRIRTLRKEIIWIFGMFAVVIGILFGSIYMQINKSTLRKTEIEQLNKRASLSSQQMSDIIRQTQSVSLSLISDPEILQSIHALSKFKGEGNKFEDTYFSNAYTMVRRAINTYFIYENFYRMIFFNENGNVIAGKNVMSHAVDSSVSYKDIEWLDNVTEGGVTVIPCHIDDWGRQKEMVLSLVKNLIGKNMGYIEVQWNKKSLDEYMQPEGEDCTILFYNLKGDLLYSYGDEAEEIDYFSYIKNAEYENIHQEIKKKKILFATHLDEENQIVAVAAKKIDTKKEILTVIPGVIVMMMTFLVVAMAYVILSSSRIAKPITQLRKIMENTELDNLTSHNMPGECEYHQIEEIGALYCSYFKVLDRLGISIEKEKQLSMLQMEAQFDLLQAQVNPHFLYNILNVISAKGIMANDESICDMCSALSRMLRYSTNTKEKLATVREEEEYLRTYFQLMKYRYEHRLEYKIEIPSEIESGVLPKVTLEQIVENSFRHGCTGVMQIIDISVIGKIEDGRWCIAVKDNGTGFTKEKIEELNEKFVKVRKHLSQHKENIELEIGGMGLVNVYARLYLVYGERLIFQIDSDSTGAIVTIGAELEGVENV